MPTLAAACLADVPKWGWGGGCLAEQPPGWRSQSNTVPPAWGTAGQGRGLGRGLGVPVYSCVYSGVFSVWHLPRASLCVNLPSPVPCMTCDAADTTILCAGVRWGREGRAPCPAAPAAL